MMISPLDDLLLVSEVLRFPVQRYAWQAQLLNPRLHLLNWQKQRVVRTLPPPRAFFDAEEFRHLRLSYHYSGARGIAASSECVFVAAQNAIYVYDRALRQPLRRIDHKLFNGLHEISWQSGRLYVTCAVTDTLLVLSEQGEELERFQLGEHAFFLDHFGLAPRHLDCRLDYRLMHRAQRLFHLNAVQVRGGQVLVLLSLQGCLAQLAPEPAILIHDAALVSSHNAQYSPDGRHILILNTGRYTLRVYDAAGQVLRDIDFRLLSLPVKFSRRRTFGGGHLVQAGWLRGLAFSRRDPQVVYVGCSPAMVVAVNYLSGACLGYLRLQRSPWVSVHGLCNLSQGPETVGLP